MRMDNKLKFNMSKSKAIIITGKEDEQIRHIPKQKNLGSWRGDELSGNTLRTQTLILQAR